MSTGSAQQTSTTTAGVSPFAQNYVDTMLSAGQQQVFNTQPNAAGGMDITGIKPYVPFGAPMDAQGNVAPYGGQQTGMGWGAYGQQQQQAPMGGMGPQSGYGSMASIIEQPQQNASTFDLFKTMGDRVRQPPTYQTAPAPQDYSTLGFDQNVTDYLNKQRQAAASDAGISYTYDPATKTFKGGTLGGPVTKTLDQIKQEAGGQGAQQQPPQQYPQQQPYGYAPGTMQAGMGPGEQMAARASVAGPSALQQRAYQNAYNMQTPGQYGEATDIGRAAGLGLLNTAGQAQGLQSLAQQAIQQGRQYGQDITNPYATQAFMSPYMQNVVNAQQREARRASDIAAQGQKAQAVQAGAFGGSRQAILEAERQRNLSTQLGDIQAQGLQSAFQNAQQQQLNAQNQAMQGYNTGIQGYGQGISGQTGAYGQAAQGAGTLSNIGGQQLGSQQSIANLQNTFGQQQQANQQQIINQAMQNYQMQRAYPQQQLSYLSSLLSGLPVSSAGQVTNIPAPSLLSQAAGLGTAGLGTYMLGNKLGVFKKGGRIKSSGAGGIAGLGLHKALNK